MKKSFTIGGLMILLIALMFALPAYSAGNFGNQIGLKMVELKVDGDIITDDEIVRTQFNRNQELDIKVRVQSDMNTTTENVEVTAMILGDEHYEISDSTDTFDMEPGVVYTKTLSLALPDIMDKDNYKLRILVADRYGAANIYNYNLKITSERHDMIVKDVSFTPENEVIAGRSFLAVVRVKNVGDRSEDSVKVKVDIPELGVSATDYIDEVDQEDSESSEELYMRIPQCARPGQYEVRVTVEYDDGFKQENQKYYINVVDAPENLCGAGSNTPATTTTTTPLPDTTTTTTTPPPPAPKTIIKLDAQSQTVKIGEGGSIYPITITNEGPTPKTYTITVDGVSTWADVRMSPSNVLIIDGGESQSAFLYVSALESASPGEMPFSITVSSDGKVLKQIPLSADLIELKEDEDNTGSIKQGLEIGLIVLVVLLIILALVIGYSKMKKSEDQEMDEDEELTGQTYY